MDVSAADATSVTDPWEPESWDADLPADSAVLALSAVREFVTIGGPEIDRCRI
jgi:hypothetical protein